MKVYLMEACQACILAEIYLEVADIDYEKVVICDSVANMKEYLSLRDTREEFAPIRESHGLGLPCFHFEDGRISFDINEALGLG